MTCIFVDDVGMAFKTTIKDSITKEIIDLSTDTVIKKLILEKPDNSVITRSADFFTDGSDGIITYTTIEGDIDMSGTWSIQAYIEGVAFKNNTCIGTFVVSETLASA